MTQHKDGRSIQTPRIKDPVPPKPRDTPPPQPRDRTPGQQGQQGGAADSLDDLADKLPPAVN
ncbi:hypothetical protein C3942_19655 [Solimonas fluminis]|uniref:Uncharacterized protein n=1 Tax=Solimonas fluminis TaxID=2086571 RepID=A0A2S5TB93_9GAMM|nr:hypothetical protein [Solimonas fluminis]PPE72118.1 hypothetical protein C3942_19655 [Solimonas fluminis]